MWERDEHFGWLGRDEEDHADERPRVAPGRVTLTSQLGTRRAVQAKTTAQIPPRTRREAAAVQLRGDRNAATDAEVHETAARGVAGFGAALPFFDQIQRSFGPSHDVSAIQAHTGAQAADAATAIGAQAYAVGDRVAFGATPDLHTAAHEAAHVIQQRRGVSLKGGVGATGDAYERHADAVADLVVRGESAAPLLDAGPSGGGGATAVQRKGLFETIGAGMGGAQAQFARYVATLLPNNPIAAQLVVSVNADDKLAGLLVELGVQLIKMVGLDQLIATAIATYASAGSAMIVAVLRVLDPIVAVWGTIPEPLQQVLIFLTGFFLQRVESYVVGMFEWVTNRAKEETGKKDDALQTHAVVTWLLEPLAASSGFSTKFSAVSQFLRAFLGGLPATTAWRSFGKYVTGWIVKKGWAAVDWLKSWMPGGSGSSGPESDDAPIEEPKQLEAPKESSEEQAPVEKAPSKIKVGPMAILPKKFGIAQTTKDKLGGMEIAAGLEVSFLESQNAVPQIDGAARVDWNGKFSWDVALTNLQLLKSADLGFLSIENVMLDRLQATDEFMELGMSAKKLRVGNFLDTGAIRFSWNSKSGLYLAVDDLALALPDPIGSVKGTLQMRIDEAGKLALFQLDKFSAGKDADFTIERAAYTTGRFAIEEAKYKLPKDVLGTDASVSASAEVSREGGLEKLGGAFTVDKLRPFDDDKVIVGGSALLGYSKADGFYFGLDNANLTVDTASFHGQAGLSAVFKTKTKALTGTVSILEIGTPFVSLKLENAKFSNKKVDGYEAGIFVDKASIRFGGATKEDTKKNIEELNPGGWSDALSLLSFAGQFFGGEVEKPRYTKAEGLKWDKIKGGLALPDEASISLFGGRLTGMYNKKTRTAALGARFAYDPLPLPTLVAEYHFVPALGVFIEFGLFGGVAAGVEAKVEQPKKEGDIDLSGKLALTGHIGVKLAGGFMVGSNYIAALKAALQGTAQLNAVGNASFHGQLVKTPDQPMYKFKTGNKDGVLFDYDLSATLIAQIALVVEASLFMIHSKQLARLNLKTWELGKFHVAGNFAEDESGKIKHTLDKPNTKTAKDPTLGGAFESTPKLDPALLSPVPVDEAIEAMAAQGSKFDDPRVANRLLTDVEDATHLTDERKTELRAKIRGSSTVSDSKRAHTTAGGAKMEIKGAKPLFEQFEKDAKEYKKQRTLGRLGITSRIMTRAQWEKYSDVRELEHVHSAGSAKRNKVKPVDDAVSAYHAVAIPDDTKPEDVHGLLAKRLDKLAALDKACVDYLATDGQRAPSVRALLKSCGEEKELLEPHLERTKVEGGKEKTD